MPQRPKRAAITALRESLPSAIRATLALPTIRETLIGLASVETIQLTLTNINMPVGLLSAMCLTLSRPVTLRVKAALDGLTANLAIHTLRPLDTLLALRSLGADLPLRAFNAHAAVLLAADLALRPFDANTLGPLGPYLTLRPLSAYLSLLALWAFRTRLALRALGLLSTTVPLDVRRCLLPSFLRLSRGWSGQRKRGTAGNPHHSGHD